MDFRGRWRRFKQRMVIIGPPLLLLLIGAATYITVVKLMEQEVPILHPALGTEQRSPSTEEIKERQSQALTAISTEVVRPTETTLSIWQAEANAGKNAWRTDPLQAAKRMGADQGFQDSDPFILEEVGEADKRRLDKDVLATHQGKDYILTMIQPLTKGSKGIWIIQSIREKK